jgi:hypothetical protein
MFVLSIQLVAGQRSLSVSYFLEYIAKEFWTVKNDSDILKNERLPYQEVGVCSLVFLSPPPIF